MLQGGTAQEAAAFLNTARGGAIFHSLSASLPMGSQLPSLNNSPPTPPRMEEVVAERTLAPAPVVEAPSQPVVKPASSTPMSTKDKMAALMAKKAAAAKANQKK
jgi:hypothetical protein